MHAAAAVLAYPHEPPCDRARPEPPPTTHAFLKSKFTAIPSAYWDTGLNRTLRPAEKEMIMLILRYTAGYLRRECALGETRFLRESGLSPSAFYGAKRSLVQRGLLMIGKTRTGRCVYRLVEWLQPVLREGARAGRAEGEAGRHLAVASAPVAALEPELEDLDEPAVSWVHAPTDDHPSGFQYAYPSEFQQPCIENKENIDQHHREQSEPDSVVSDDDFEIERLLETVEQQWAEPTLALQPEQPLDEQLGQGSGAQPAERPPQAAAPEVSRSLAKALQDLGVNQFVARRLTRQHSQDKIDAAMARTRKVHPENPAGYVVAELQRGGYQDKPDPTKVARQVAEEIHNQRAVERKREAQENEERNARALAPLAPFEQLPPEVQAQIHQRVAGLPEAKLFLSRDRRWGPGSPGYEGLLAVVVAEYLGGGEDHEAHRTFLSRSSGLDDGLPHESTGPQSARPGAHCVRGRPGLFQVT